MDNIVCVSSYFFPTVRSPLFKNDFFSSSKLVQFAKQISNANISAPVRDHLSKILRRGRPESQPLPYHVSRNALVCAILGGYDYYESTCNWTSEDEIQR